MSKASVYYLPQERRERKEPYRAMIVRCVCCQKESEFTDVTVSYVHVHRGECSRWLKDREDFGPSWIWKLGNSNLTSLVCFLVGVTIMLVLVQ